MRGVLPCNPSCWGTIKERTYDHVARIYDPLDLPFEYGRYRPIRRVLFEGVSGTILDAGVGTGRNMPFYPASGEVIGIDMSPQMLARARKRKAKLEINCELRQMDVPATDFPDGRFNYVIASFLFCVLDDKDQLPALRELRRVCKPNGEIRLLEYTYSRNPLRRFVMRLWAPWVRMIYGATFDRHTERHVEAAGLKLVEHSFVLHDILWFLVLQPH